MNQIHISITGTTGVGKSTIAQAIARSLSFNHGIDIKIIDEDNAADDWEGERIEQCLESMAGNTEIVITTYQAKRKAA